jgi:AraC-like DNA-binding protein
MILFLTVPIIMPRLTSPVAQSSLKGIERLSQGVAAPKSYLQGWSPRNPILPTNIVCFVRRNADLLSNRHLRPRDQHHRFVLIVAIRGTGEVCIDLETFSLREGQVQLVFPFQFHSYAAIQPARICWIYVTFELEEKGGLQALRSSPSRDLDKSELALFTEIIRSWNSGNPPPLLQHQLAMFLGRLNARKMTPIRRPKQPAESHDTGILFQVNRYAMPRLDRPIAIKTMATALGHSESHLRRLFRLATGLGIGRYIRELRWQRACRLLQDLSMSVGDVAAQCGFDSIYSFSRAFKSGLNISPRAYRRTWRDQR